MTASELVRLPGRWRLHAVRFSLSETLDAGDDGNGEVLPR
jgi:hypothetical protein